MPHSNRILIAVPESDAHVVAAKLLEYFMCFHGFEVVNLGANTSVAEIVEAARSHEPLAILISSQNGHAMTDLSGLTPALRDSGACTDVILGGKLSIDPSHTLADHRQSYVPLGFRVAGDFEEALTMIYELQPGFRGGLLAVAN
jgi:methylaspartate mutase sigma subunit